MDSEQPPRRRKKPGHPGAHHHSEKPAPKQPADSERPAPPPRRAQEQAGKPRRQPSARSQTPGGPLGHNPSDDTAIIAKSLTAEIPIPKRVDEAGRSGDMPIEKVAYLLNGLILVFGWCAMANAYHSDDVGRPMVVESSSDFISGVTMVISMGWSFVRNSLVYLLSIPTVLKYVLTERLIIPFVMAIAVGGVFAFVRLSDGVSAELKQGYERSEHRRGRVGTPTSASKRSSKRRR